LEGGSIDIFQDTTLTFTWKDWGTPRRASVSYKHYTDSYTN